MPLFVEVEVKRRKRNAARHVDLFGERAIFEKDAGDAVSE